MYEKELEKLLMAAGADLVGFSELGENRSPEHPEYGYAVTIARKLSRAVIKTINGAPTMEYFQHYRATNARLDSIRLVYRKCGISRPSRRRLAEHTG